MVFRVDCLLCVFLGFGLAGDVVGSESLRKADQPGPRSLSPDRTFDVLPSPPWPEGIRTPLAQAAERLGDRKIQLAGTEVNAALLSELSKAEAHEALVRVMRETLAGAVDPKDFLFFMDDVLREGPAGSLGEVIWITPSRARNAGIFLHTDDVFAGKPRRYGEHGSLATDRPRRQLELPAARDGDLLGPHWATRFRNPASEAERLAALDEVPGATSFAIRIRSLVEQLRAQGAQAELTSTLRMPERGYLMWGAFMLSRAEDAAAVSEALRKLRSANSDWELQVPIRWEHPDGWRATREAAREMADTYQVVFATESGARSSDHYTGRAADLVAVALPRSLELIAPDGQIGRFDLSREEHTRDLSLSPELIEWVEIHFDLKKLRGDYPHWVDDR